MIPAVKTKRFKTRLGICCERQVKCHWILTAHNPKYMRQGVCSFGFDVPTKSHLDVYTTPCALVKLLAKLLIFQAPNL